MIRKQKNGLTWLEFEILQQYPEVAHGVFLRSGGESKGPYDSLNVGGETGDDRELIDKNRQKIVDVLGISSLISSRQVHGDVVKDVSELVSCEECDGIITKEKNMGLLIKHADCQAAIFFDPINKVIANVHCGWKGNVQNIYAKTVEMMQEKIGTSPEDLIVCISPSLGPDRSEFVNFENEFPFDLWPFQFKKFYFNLWEMSRAQLEEAGVLSGNIEVASICTYDNPEDYYSYRRDKVTGRNATVVALK